MESMNMSAVRRASGVCALGAATLFALAVSSPVHAQGLEMAEDVVGRFPTITHLKNPPIVMADVK